MYYMSQFIDELIQIQETSGWKCETRCFKYLLFSTQDIYYKRGIFHRLYIFALYTVAHNVILGSVAETESIQKWGAIWQGHSSGSK